MKVTDTTIAFDYVFNFLGSHEPDEDDIKELAREAGVNITDQRAERIAKQIKVVLDKQLQRAKDHLQLVGYSLGPTRAEIDEIEEIAT